MNMLYFAYGSNMSTRRLRQRVPSATVVTTGHVAGHRLAWDKRSASGGKCDLETTGDSANLAYGVIYEIPVDEKPKLDDAEGLGHGYDEKTVMVITANGPLEACTYYATDKDPTLKPYHWYQQHVLIGARQHGLPHDYVSAIERVASIDDPDRERAAKELAIYTGS